MIWTFSVEGSPLDTEPSMKRAPSMGKKIPDVRLLHRAHPGLIRPLGPQAEKFYL